MSSRGTYNKLGFASTEEYSKVEDTEFLNSVVLVGNNGLHGLPDYSHSKPDRIYIKLDRNGFRELRYYDSFGKVSLEIGYHPEKNLTGNKKTKVLHYHLFGPNLEHYGAHLMIKEIYNMFKVYLNHWGIYWND